MNKKGISNVVATMILVVLTFTSVSIIWVSISNLISEETENSQACFNILDKVTLNRENTCYNEAENELQFSINREDLDVDNLLVSVSNGENSISFEILEAGSEIIGLTMDGGSSTIVLPGDNGGKTYILNLVEVGLAGTPKSIQIAPSINGVLCDVTDSLNQFGSCGA